MVPLDDPKTCADPSPGDWPEDDDADQCAREKGQTTADGVVGDEPADSAFGRLHPEVIRAIVRSQNGRFRSCYEAGLGRHPDLEGRVTVLFVIGTEGKVSNVVVDDTDLPDCAVARCVRDAFAPIEFPKPECGIVTVQYPILFQPG